MSLPETVFIVEDGKEDFLITARALSLLEQPDGEMVGEYRLVRKGRIQNQEPVVKWLKTK